MVTVTDCIVVGIPVTLAIMGAYVSISPPAEVRHKWLWVSAFSVLGIIFFITSLRQISENRQNEEKTEQSRHVLQKQLETAQNQLNDIQAKVAKIGEQTNDQTIKRLLSTIVKIRDEHSGKIVVPKGADHVTIIHGYTDPNVVVLPLANWNTSLYPSKQDEKSITFTFSNEAPFDGVISWKASRLIN